MSRTEHISCDMPDCTTTVSRSDASKLGWRHVDGKDLCYKCLDELLALHRKNLLASNAYDQRWNEGIV